MGEVYRARDTELERDVAIKVLPEAVSQSPDRLERFRREAKAVAKLAHPNILEIWDYGTEGETTYAVTELLEGETLRERLEGGALGWRKATEIGAAIADGLGAAHEAGIVHRDLKPSNVFLTSDGRVKVLDFGLARSEAAAPSAEESEIATRTDLTEPGAVLGTVGYMSPEQVSAQPLDHRSDIFSLGCVLYEMVSGDRAFTGKTAVDTMAAILNQQPAELSGMVAPLPADLDSTIRRCLEKQAPARFQSASDLAYNLRSISSASAPFIVQPAARTPPWRKAVLWIGGAAVIVVAAALLITWPRQPVPPVETPPAQPKRIAVLVFKNLGLPEEAYFAYGMTDEITSRLSAVSGLGVISRTTADRYQHTDKSLQEIGEELNVAYVLEGSVFWDSQAEGRGRVRITPQLIRVSDDTHLWSGRYERAFEDIFEVQSDIARHVIDNLQVALLEPERRAVDAKPTDNMDAYNAYLRGLTYAGSLKPAEHELAGQMFQRAVELDPGFALGHAALAGFYSRGARVWPGRVPDGLERAWRSAKRALELDPNLPEAHLAAGWVHLSRNELEETLERGGIAARLQPSNPDVLILEAMVFRRQGRLQEVLPRLERAVNLDPQNPQNQRRGGSLMMLADTLRLMRRFPEAADAIDRVIAIAPDRPGGYMYKLMIYSAWHGPSKESRKVLEENSSRFPNQWGWVIQEFGERNYQAALEWLDRAPAAMLWSSESLAEKPLRRCACYHAMNRPEQKRKACEAALDILKPAAATSPNDPWVHVRLGGAYALLGRKADAMSAVRQALELEPNPGTPFLFEGIAQTYAHVDESDQALDLIEQLLSRPGELTVARLRLEPNWDPLRDHPRFQEILEKYGAEQRSDYLNDASSKDPE
jgi:TolB-like protein/cytochrome c-type biogenesis protein CcmH/NrfG